MQAENRSLTKSLEKKANRIRKTAITMVHDCSAGHIGGAMSCTDLLVTLYYQVMNVSSNQLYDPDRDRFILSKGHSLETYLCILQDKGYITCEELFTFGKDGSRLYEHPNRELPGVEANTGALGHGLSIGAGMAFQLKRTGSRAKVFILMGDGELAEGSVWEAAMFCSNYKLDNLYVLVDRNHLQISGNTEDVMRLEPLNKKWESFGFSVKEVDGNDIDQILRAFSRLQKIQGLPKVLIANTIKGKGISFMEGNPKWHHGQLDDDLFSRAVTELDEAYKII